ncbi:uncharacterized protein CXorf65 homolog [Argopecten irradians]|uniref:uncharacterized protein CXorf65 homolog n=1 Tax=Argopecten irradians TaxID=31199 RepID=UPI003723C1D3
MVYVTVRYGDCEEEIFNPFCRARNLLRSIKQKCRCKNDFDIELCDESGNIKFLRDVPNRYANEILTERETLVLLRVDKSSGASDTYVPLLNDEESINDDFTARLAGRGMYDSRPGSRRVRSNTRRPKADKNGDRDRSKEKQKSARPEKRSKSRQGK